MKRMSWCFPFRAGKARFFLPTLGLGLSLVLICTSGGCKSGKSAACPCKSGQAAAAGCGTCPTPAVAGATNAPAPAEEEVEEGELIFDGQSLKGWKITPFAGHGEVEVKDGKIILHEGIMTGVNYTNPIPRMNYEVTWEGCRVAGTDFFASLTFPVGETHCTLITGGWGGGVVGISSIDSMDASENETTQFIAFENGRWYRFRVRVTPDKIEAWVDNKKVANVNTKGKKIDVRPGEIEESRPFGFAAWSTTGAIKNVRIRKLD
ncbi:DUF1080 domain-containing protein [Fontisphaera persica]|uniref:3-keto-disaccharide hydrolase n=1 Tax=Fontisphaera persica TaxID=2974023 RepID=UPI0024BF7B6F|nr:DUF1080 domain-containing protein [Fontisphaera persica]WCJ59216.1 DUF1080 domain-containing protein [Fontisphaera persica]